MNDLQTFETGTATVGESATVQNPFGAPLAQGGASNISTAQIVSREVAETPRKSIWRNSFRATSAKQRIEF
ncbi:MAG: hypothetical protein IJO06_04580 [Thermoguttaceae bacterium]|nr:hypothetical protein [Thermoguttaceae bacterium]